MTNTPIEALSAINVGVVNDQGLLEAVITLEEFVRVAKVSTSTCTLTRHAEKSTLILPHRTLIILLPR